MNGKRKVLIGFTTDSDDFILVEAKTVVSSMTNNSFFELPVPPMVEVALGVETYENALIKARQTKSIQDMEAKKVAKLNLQNLLSRLANYVNLIADGDVAKLESSGFQLNKPRQYIGILDAPHAITLSSVRTGQVDIKIDKVENASGYLVMFREIGEDIWHSELLSKTTGTIKNLKSVARYEFKTAATSSASSSLNEYNYSQIISVLVQ